MKRRRVGIHPISFRELINESNIRYGQAMLNGIDDDQCISRQKSFPR